MIVKTDSKELTRRWFELQEQATFDSQEMDFWGDVVRSGVVGNEKRQANRRIRFLKARIDDAYAEMGEIESNP